MTTRQRPKRGLFSEPEGSPPAKLYQYRSCSNQNLHNLFSRQLWFSAFDQLNDPLDSPGVVDLDRLQIEPLVDIFHNPKTGELTQRFNPNPPPRGSAWDRKWRKLKTSLDDQLKTSGLACFSEIHDNLPMWAHYAAKHSGYCLEFSTSKQPISAAQRISYVSQLAPFNPYTRHHPEDPTAVPLLTKHKDWSYEKEWRVIAHGEANRNVGYPATAVTGIYLGSRIRPRNEALIRTAAERANLRVEFYRMQVRGLALVATPA